jgi:methionyl-tRNA formyltransferase
VTAVRPLRIVFFGTPAFAVPTLEQLLESRHDVVGVVTQPDRPRGRGQRVSDAPVKAVAMARGLPVLQPERLKRDAVEKPVEQLAPDLGVVAAYGKLLPEWLLQLPRLGMINVHASLLPKYRGAAPVHRAVLAGEAETGVTIMRVVKELDAGPMLAWASRPIGPNETSEIVERDLAVQGAELLGGLLDDLAAGRVRERPQNDAEATYAPRLTKEEGQMAWTRSAGDLHNQVRGLRPWPAAYTFLDSARVVVHQSRRSDVPTGDALPGTCLAAGTVITVACGDGRALDLVQVQLEGRRSVSAREFVAGRPGLAGQRFGPP